MKKVQPLHLDGLSFWINRQGEKAPVCPRCKTDENVSWKDGEWICSECRHVVDK